MGKRNDELRIKILGLYESGLGGIKISQQLGLHPQTVYYHLKTADKPKGGRQTKTDGDEVVRLYTEEKLSCQQIADKLGLTDAGTVYIRLKNRNIKFRTKSQGMIARGLRKIGSDEEVLKLYRSGLSQTAVAKIYGVNNKCVYDILKRHNTNRGRPYGDQNPAWKGGTKNLNKIIRECAKYIEYRNACFKRDNYTCQITEKVGGNLHAHHICELHFLVEDFLKKYGLGILKDHKNLYKKIDQYEPFWDLTNVITISEEVHDLIHAGKKIDWKQDIRSFLSVQPIDRAGAKRLINNYHYLHSIPNGTEYYYGLFCGASLIGACTFGKGANKNLSSGVGGPALELTRLYTVDWSGNNFGSFFLSRVIRLLKQDSDGIEWLVSFADPDVGHLGSIYKAANWQYVGQTKKDYKYQLPNGVFVHKSKFRCKDGKNEHILALEAKAVKMEIPGKYKYVWRLNA